MNNRMGLYPDELLIDLLPCWYREIGDYQAICAAEQQEFDRLAGNTSLVLDNFFPQSLTEAGLREWEQVLGIGADPRTESIAFRRARVLNRLSTKPPFTLNFLRRKLDELIGKDKWNIHVDYPNYTLYVESSAKDQSYAVEVAYTIGRIKPAHIVYVNVPFVSSQIELSEEAGASRSSWNYALGSWRLGEKPFGTVIRSEVVKMASQTSLQQELLNGVAGFTSGKIASARINGSVIVSPLTHTVEGSTLSVSYSVSGEQAKAVTLIELLDEGGAVLSRAPVYVPVEGSVQMRHRILVKEGGD